MQFMQLDKLKELLGVRTDTQLAQRIGYSKQAISSARERGRISEKILEKSSYLLGMTMHDLEELLGDQKYAYNINKKSTRTQICQNEPQKHAYSPESPALAGYLMEEVLRQLNLAREDAQSLRKERDNLLHELAEQKARIGQLEERLKIMGILARNGD